jgi:hypothetical protein
MGALARAPISLCGQALTHTLDRHARNVGGAWPSLFLARHSRSTHTSSSRRRRAPGPAKATAPRPPALCRSAAPRPGNDGDRAEALCALSRAVARRDHQEEGAGIAVEGGSTRTTVRSRTSTTIHGSGRRARTSAQVQAFGNGHLVPAMPARAPAGATLSSAEPLRGNRMSLRGVSVPTSKECSSPKWL